ncbi:MAG: PilT/PilU family type 4a pilus ATPase [Chloroflexi bacterium]|nr:PilT/PilU family type 4a pilus ATPase [Chloroflexota bacterium]
MNGKDKKDSRARATRVRKKKQHDSFVDRLAPSEPAFFRYDYDATEEIELLRTKKAEEIKSREKEQQPVVIPTPRKIEKPPEKQAEPEEKKPAARLPAAAYKKDKKKPEEEKPEVIPSADDLLEKLPVPRKKAPPAGEPEVKEREAAEEKVAAPAEPVKEEPVEEEPAAEVEEAGPEETEDKEPSRKRLVPKSTSRKALAAKPSPRTSERKSRPAIKDMIPSGPSRKPELPVKKEKGRAERDTIETVPGRRPEEEFEDLRETIAADDMHETIVSESMEEEDLTETVEEVVVAIESVDEEEAGRHGLRFEDTGETIEAAYYSEGRMVPAEEDYAVINNIEVLEDMRETIEVAAGRHLNAGEFEFYRADGSIDPEEEVEEELMSPSPLQSRPFEPTPVYATKKVDPSAPVIQLPPEYTKSPGYGAGEMPEAASAPPEEPMHEGSRLIKGLSPTRSISGATDIYRSRPLIRRKEAAMVAVEAVERLKGSAPEEAGTRHSKLQYPVELASQMIMSGSREYDLSFLLRKAADQGASDLHLDSVTPPSFRINGDLVKSNFPPFSDERLIGEISPFISQNQRKHLVETGELDFTLDVDRLGRFRVNLYRHKNGLAAAFRYIQSRIPTLRELNLPKQLKKLIHFRKGLVIVTGPTGSGKSTTLAAIINEINRSRSAHIITIEDPLEFIHKNQMSLVTHREIGVHSLRYSDALHSAIKEDPDIIMLGEMRDLETISLAIEAASMGLLVFSTLHTNSAAKVPERIIDVFPHERQARIRTALADSLKAAVAQQLIKRLDNKGRVPSVEVLFATAGLSNMIRENKTHQIYSLIQTGKDMGMQSMDQAILELAQNHVITPEAALERITDPGILQRAGLIKTVY